MSVLTHREQLIVDFYQRRREQFYASLVEPKDDFVLDVPPKTRPFPLPPPEPVSDVPVWAALMVAVCVAWVPMCAWIYWRGM